MRPSSTLIERVEEEMVVELSLVVVLNKPASSISVGEGVGQYT